jgi:hypothetical protein
LRHVGEVIDEGLYAVGHMQVVRDVHVAGALLDGYGRQTLSCEQPIHPERYVLFQPAF